MTDATHPAPIGKQAVDARDLQARLYREIGISAVAAALRAINQPEPGKPAPVQRDVLPFLRDEHKAA